MAVGEHRAARAGRCVPGLRPRRVTTGILLIAALAASCSIDLDESLIGRPPATTPERDGGPVLPGIDAGGDAGGPTTSVSCSSDDACTTTDACLKGKCDLGRKTCVYDVCRPSACNAGTCDANARTCSAPAPYKLRANQFSLGTQILCQRCAVATHPWLFVLTPAGAIAFNVANPTNKTPPQVPIVGLGFVPSQIIQSQNRVWLLGGGSGPGPSRIPIAYIDPPSDPFASRLVAQTVLATYNRPGPEGLQLFPQGDASLFVGPAVAQFASFVALPPLVEPASFSGTPFPPIANATAAATSGKRLLMSAVTDQLPSFQLVDNAGSAMPVAGAAIAAADPGPVSVSRAFAQSLDGAIFWATGVHHAPLEIRTRALRGYFLTANETGLFAPSAGIDIEVYSQPGLELPANFAIVGSTVAMLDASTANVASVARETPAQTAVQFVKRDPPGVVKEPDNVTPRRQLLPIPLGAIAATTASNRIAYVVANDVAGPPPTGTVYVYDPACAP